MCPGVLLLGLSVGDLRDQLIVPNLELLTENLGHHHGAGGLGVDHAAAVEVLEHPEEEVGVGRDVVAGAGRLPAQLRVAVAVKLRVESEHVLLLQPVQMYLPGRDEDMLPENYKKIKVYLFC